MDDFFNQKRYIGKWTPIYHFADLGDTDNFFIELQYFINKSHYLATKSSIGSALDLEMVDGDGVGLFANLPSNTLAQFTSRNYKLAFVSEGIEYNEEGDLVIVTERYTYAPNQIYTNFENDVVPIWGLNDNTESVSANVIFGKKNVIDSSFYKHSILDLGANASKFNSGDRIQIAVKQRFYICYHSGPGAPYEFYPIIIDVHLGSENEEIQILNVNRQNGTIEISSSLPRLMPGTRLGDDAYEHTENHYNNLGVLDQSQTNAYMACCKCYWDTIRGEPPKHIHTATLFPIALTITRAYSTREFKRRERPVRVKTSFSTSQPDISDLEIFVPKLESGLERDVISRETTTTALMWKQKIKNGEYFRYAEPEVEFDLINNIYKLKIKETKCS